MSPPPLSQCAQLGAGKNEGEGGTEKMAEEETEQKGSRQGGKKPAVAGLLVEPVLGLRGGAPPPCPRFLCCPRLSVTAASVILLKGKRGASFSLVHRNV